MKKSEKMCIVFLNPKFKNIPFSSFFSLFHPCIQLFTHFYKIFSFVLIIVNCYFILYG